MGIVARRIWRSVGWWGLAFSLFAIIVAYSMIFAPTGNIEESGWRVITLTVIALVTLVYRMRGYQRPQATRSYEEILEPLLSSAEKFCLVLRPFGQDGENFLRLYKMTKKMRRKTSQLPYANILTLEQVIARSVHRAVQQKTYALVDQSRKVAPPGPVYVRAPDQNWQAAVLPLIQHAHSVILWLPPGQDLRESFNWEVEQIVRGGLQRRTIIVLPPPDQQADAHRRAVEQAAVLLATMETPSGKAAEADQLNILYYEDKIGDQTLMMKFQLADEGDRQQLVRWFVQYSPRKWRLRKPRVDASVYENGLVELLTGMEKEVTGPGFPADHPPLQ